VPGEEAVRSPGTTIEADGYYQQRWSIYEHIGTHVDAPAHFNPNGRFADELTTRELMVPAVVIDIADRAAADPDTVVTVADLRTYERRYGRIDDGTAVLMYSGWGVKVRDPNAYRGPDAAGVLHFPGFGSDACEWLLRRRKIRALGVDTLSIDPGNSATFEVRKVLNGADRYGIENLANMDSLPPGVPPSSSDSSRSSRVQEDRPGSSRIGDQLLLDVRSGEQDHQLSMANPDPLPGERTSEGNARSTPVVIA